MNMATIVLEKTLDSGYWLDSSLYGMEEISEMKIDQKGGEGP